MHRPTTSIKVTGHRGAMALALENTAQSLAIAEQHGADELEFDIRLSADDVAVVVHDATLARICGNPSFDAALRALSWNAIESVPLPGGQRVLTLVQLLELTSVLLQVEVKELAAVAAVAAELARRPQDRARCLIASSSMTTLREAGSLLPDVPRGLIVKHYHPGAVEQLQDVGGSWLLSGWPGLDPDVVGALADDGVLVGGWPLRDTADALLATELGVAAITADDPGAARRWLDEVDQPRRSISAI